MTDEERRRGPKQGDAPIAKLSGGNYHERIWQSVPFEVRLLGPPGGFALGEDLIAYPFDVDRQLAQIGIGLLEVTYKVALLLLVRAGGQNRQLSLQGQARRQLVASSYVHLVEMIHRGDYPHVRPWLARLLRNQKRAGALVRQAFRQGESHLQAALILGLLKHAGPVSYDYQVAVGGSPADLSHRVSFIHDRLTLDRMTRGVDVVHTYQILAERSQQAEQLLVGGDIGSASDKARSVVPEDLPGSLGIDHVLSQHLRVRSLGKQPAQLRGIARLFRRAERNEER